MAIVTEDRLAAAIADLRAYIDRRFGEIEKRFAEQTRWIVGWTTVLVGLATSTIIAVLK